MTQHAINLRDGIVESIRAAFPVEAVPTVRPYDGPVDADMVKRYALRAPAILLTVLGGKTTAMGGSVHDLLSFGLYILAKGRKQLERSKSALMIRERLAKLIPEADVYPAGSHKPPRSIDWRNMFDEEIDGMGLVLWVGAWDHLVVLPGLEPEEYADLDDFARMHAEIFNPGGVADAPETGEALTEQLIELPTAED